MKRLTLLLLGLCCGLWYSGAMAYLQPTHQNIASAAAAQSVLADINTLHNLGLQRSIIDIAQTFPNYVDEDIEPDIGLYLTSGRKNILNLIVDGAMQEDEGTRSLAHFYDPTTNQGLNTTGLPVACQAVIAGLTGPLPWLANGLSFLPSPDWSLEDTNYFNAQAYSYKHARSYFFDALTTPDKTTREQYWGKTFQALGQVIHHIEDMAQPQHVRNDPHLSYFKGEPCENPSLYEKLANENRGSLPYTPPYALDLSIFPTPRAFWKNETPGHSGTGMAEFTNANFFSFGTNVGSGRYGSPMLTGEATLCVFPNAGSQPRCPIYTNPNVSGTMTFYSTVVTDAYAPQLTQVNPLATTESLFDQYLKDAGSSPVFALNQFNFTAAQSFLIPRAVAYSAGMLNYFVRGQMEISLPDEGVYAIADSALPAGSDPQVAGFYIVKLKLRNRTGGTDSNGNAKEAIAAGSTGSLVAVAKFHRNHCYAMDLSGEYGSRSDSAGQQDWLNTCRDSNEEIVTSDRAYAPDGINTSPQEVTFFFTGNIPFSATDLYLQVVYRGPLGQEPDAVVVTTKDISEPTYLFNYSNWDIDQFCGAYPYFSGRNGGCPSTTLTFHQWCTLGGSPFPDDATCSRMATYTLSTQFSPTSAPIPGYDPNNPPTTPTGPSPITNIQKFHPLVDMPALPVWPASLGVAGTTPGNLSRVAVLTDTNSQNTQLVMSEQDDTVNNLNDFQWHNNTFTPTINQFGDNGVWQSISPNYQKSRGQYIDPNYLIPMGDPSLYIFGISPLQLQCSQVSPAFGGSPNCNWTPPFPESW